jgi:GWxTD domain-containing protein
MTFARRGAAVAFFALAAAGHGTRVDAAALTDLFQKAKLEVAAGDYRRGLETLSQLEAEAARPENEAARAPLRPAAAFYRGVCLAATGHAEEARAEFAVYISANPEKGIDPRAYPRKVTAAFEEARKSARASSSDDASSLSSLAVAYRQTGYSRPSSTAPGTDWAAGPAKFLLTVDEIRDFTRISEDAERAEFVSRFWLGRMDPDAEQRGKRESLRREFERRAAFADEHFTDSKRRGSLTDRGMVFLLLGPPSAVIRRPISASNDAPSMLTMNGAANPAPRGPIGLSPSDQPANWLEIWRYNRDLLPEATPYSVVDFPFQTRIDYGENVLQREPPVLRTLEEARARWRGRKP